MIHVLRQAPSTGAMELVSTLGETARRWRTADRLARKVRVGDTVVFWGESGFAPRAGVRTLNAAPLQNKMSDIQHLTARGVRTVQMAATRPAPQLVTQPDPAIVQWNALSEACAAFADDIPFMRGEVARASLRELQEAAGQLHMAFATPIPPPVPAETWLPRVRNHIGGLDLLTPPQHADFWVKKEQFVEEYRVHSFMGRSIRSGIKVPRISSPGSPLPLWAPHAWIRSWDGGWRMSYDGTSITQRIRDIAHNAVEALGLQFGAVDVGVLADGTPVVLEVNRAPGMEGGTLAAYAAAITAYAGQQE